MSNLSYEHRKSARTVRILNSDGTPVAKAQVQLKQTKHEFLFGCGAFDFLPYTNKEGAMEDPFLKDRIEKWLALYNYGTLPFYLGQYEKEEGKPEQESRMNMARFINGKGLTVKGHPLCWHTACADWLMQYDNETILKKQLKRIERDVTAFKGQVDIWDVINEVVIMPDFDKYDNAITRICKEYGRVNLVKRVFEEAKAANPDAQLLLNDFNTSISYQILIDGCLNAGAPIDTIGIQSHQHQGYWGKEKLETVLERFSVFGKPIHFTENTLISGGFLVPPEIEDLNDFQVSEWPSTPEGEERQMKQVEEMYRILFAHPLVEAITGWDFADGAWLGAPSGVLRKDNSTKPVYHKLMEMIKGEWWTDTTIMTDENGYAMAEGFKGDYEIVVGEKKASLVLSKDMSEQQIVLA